MREVRGGQSASPVVGGWACAEGGGCFGRGGRDEVADPGVRVGAEFGDFFVVQVELSGEHLEGIIDGDRGDVGSGMWEVGCGEGRRSS